MNLDMEKICEYIKAEVESAIGACFVYYWSCRVAGWSVVL
jgi:hypothetical protein